MRKLPLIVLLLASIACNAAANISPTEAPPTAEAPPTEAPTAEAPPTEAPTAEAPPTEAPTAEAPPTEAASATEEEAAPTEEATTAPETDEEVEGGFLDSNIDLDEPTLTVAIGGGPPLICGTEATDDPALEIVAEIGGSTYLCLVNFPLEEGTRADIDITNGEYSYFSEFFTQGDQVFGPEGQPRGDLYPDPPAWGMWISIPAWLPQNTWTITARSGSIEASVDHTPNPNVRFISMGTQPLPENPLVYPEPFSGLGDDAYAFTAGDEVIFAGAAYDPDTTLTVAVYDAADPEVLTPVDATSIRTDATGRWRAVYVIGSDMAPGRYVVTTNPTVDDPVTPFNGYFNVVGE